MPPRREPGTADVEDLFKLKNGGKSALLKRLEAQGKDPATYKRWRVRWVDDKGSQQSKRFRVKSEATAFMKNVVADIVQGDYVDVRRGKVTVSQVHEQWEPTTIILSEKTRSDRLNIWKNHVEPQWGHEQIGDVGKNDIQQWVADLHARGLSESLINQAVGVLRLTLQHAVDERRLKANPATDIRIPRSQPNERYYLTVPQVEALATEVGPVYETLIRVLAYCGIRWGEAAALRVQDVDLDRGRLKIVKAKSKESRSVPFPSVIAKEVMELTEGREPGDRLFTTPSGTPLNASNFRQRHYIPALGSAGRELGQALPPVTVHDLRHTAASLAISAGANVKAVQRMLGHKSAAVTLDTYSDLFDDDLNEVAARMTDLILLKRASG